MRRQPPPAVVRALPQTLVVWREGDERGPPMFADPSRGGTTNADELLRHLRDPTQNAAAAAYLVYVGAGGPATRMSGADLINHLLGLEPGRSGALFQLVESRNGERRQIRNIASGGVGWTLDELHRFFAENHGRIPTNVRFQLYTLDGRIVSDVGLLDPAARPGDGFWDGPVVSFEGTRRASSAS